MLSTLSSRSVEWSYRISPGSFDAGSTIVISAMPCSQNGINAEARDLVPCFSKYQTQASFLQSARLVSVMPLQLGWIIIKPVTLLLGTGEELNNTTGPTSSPGKRTISMHRQSGC